MWSSVTVQCIVHDLHTQFCRTLTAGVLKPCLWQRHGVCSWFWQFQLGLIYPFIKYCIDEFIWLTQVSKHSSKFRRGIEILDLASTGHRNSWFSRPCDSKDCPYRVWKKHFVLRCSLFQALQPIQLAQSSDQSFWWIIIWEMNVF